MRFAIPQPQATSCEASLRPRQVHQELGEASEEGPQRDLLERKELLKGFSKDFERDVKENLREFKRILKESTREAQRGLKL